MDKSKLQRIHEKIREFERIILLPHARPDGDCMGAAFGLQDMIKTTYPKKEVYVSGEEAEYVKFLGRTDEVPDSAFEGALVIAVDTANPERIADQRYDKGKFLIKIDHHILVESFGDIEYVDTARPATTLIVLDLYRLHEDTYRLTQKGIQALYTGTLTDTGRFKYPGVDGDTFRAIAVLYDMGLETEDIFLNLDVQSQELTRFKGYVLQNYKKTANGVAYIEITHELIDEYGVTLEEASSLVNELGVFEDCPVWTLLAEYEEKEVRARLRSKGPAVNEIANLFDGGGHKLASGANLGTWARAKELLEALDELVAGYKKGNR